MVAESVPNPNAEAAAYSLGKPYFKDVAAHLDPDVVYRVPLAALSIERDFNARDFSTPENKEHVARLAKLVAEAGVQNPVRVRIVGERLVVVDGESRVRAAYKAQAEGSKAVKEIPVLLDPDGDDEIARTEALVIKNTGRPLSMLETLSVVKRLSALGMNKTDIQSKLSFSRTHYANLMSLDKATDATFEYLREGLVSPTLVVDLLKLHKEPEIVETAVKRAVAKAERDAERVAAEAPGKKKSKRARPSADDGPIYTRQTFNSLARALQDVYAVALPASEHRKIRSIIKNTLENAGFPLVIEEEIAEEEAA